MRISGPDRYRLSFTASAFTVKCQAGTPSFSGIATCKKPKLYVVSIYERPIYVGVTRQSMRTRLRLGWTAEGQTGYYGYAWRRTLAEANLDIWCHEDAPTHHPERDMETVEAEVVFLIRSAGQWPEHQTEIHFYQSNAEHREIAASIMNRYGLANGVSQRFLSIAPE